MWPRRVIWMWPGQGSGVLCAQAHKSHARGGQPIVDGARGLRLLLRVLGQVHDVRDGVLCVTDLLPLLIGHPLGIPVIAVHAHLGQCVLLKEPVAVDCGPRREGHVVLHALIVQVRPRLRGNSIAHGRKVWLPDITLHLTLKVPHRRSLVCLPHAIVVHHAAEGLEQLLIVLRHRGGRVRALRPLVHGDGGSGEHFLPLDLLLGRGGGQDAGLAGVVPHVRASLLGVVALADVHEVLDVLPHRHVAGSGVEPAEALGKVVPRPREAGLRLQAPRGVPDTTSRGFAP
mmetsp:Transcript_30175/g.54268  ORF Transcript_30175/g.54268 Transcript_30175/m.54268 type:complete len:286 (-) Transcript_30175:90-947(-)